MRIYTGTSNVTDLQIQTSTSVLMFELTKTAPAPSLFHFFGQNQATNRDVIRLLYNDNVVGQRSIINGLDVLPVALIGTVSPNEIQCLGSTVTNDYWVTPTGVVLSDVEKKFFDSNLDDLHAIRKSAYYRRLAGLSHVGLKVVPALSINKVRFFIRVGYDGSLELNQSQYLSLTTFFQNVSQLNIYSIEGRRTTSVIKYESMYMQPRQEAEVVLLNSLLTAFPKNIESVQLTTVASAESSSYSADYTEPELAFLAREVNDVQVVVGCEDEILASPVVGPDFTYPLGFRNQWTMAGGYGFDVLGTVHYARAKVLSNYAGHVFLSRVYNISELVS
jgi:hypothetical protein